MQQTQEMWVQYLGRKIPWSWKWQPLLVFLPGKFYGQMHGFQLLHMPTDYTNDFKYSLEFLLSKTETSDSWYNGSLIRDSFCFTRKKTKHRAGLDLVISQLNMIAINLNSPSLFLYRTIFWCTPKHIKMKQKP